MRTRREVELFIRLRFAGTMMRREMTSVGCPKKRWRFCIDCIVKWDKGILICRVDFFYSNVKTDRFNYVSS